jgi:apolipoprotein N-acyltransferase
MTKLASYAYPDEAVQRDLQNRMARLQEDMVAEHAVNDWDLLILPESSFTEPDIASNPVVRERISGLARAAGCDMLVGGNRDLSTEARSEVYNSSFLVHGDGQWDAAHYDKMRLVPFGESLPYFDMIPGFQEHVVGIGSFNEGRSQTIFTTRGRGGEKSPVAFGVLICFESTFSSLARGLARAGAEFLVVQTNDAWYGLSAGAAQHHHLSQLRAVETGRWVLRCANTGISSIIAPSGRLVASLPLGRRGLLRHAIGLPENPAATPYCLIGNFWLSAPALLLLAGLALSVRNARRELLR